MIEKLLKEAKEVIYGKEYGIEGYMYNAIEATLHASELDPSTRKANYLKLIMLCASEERCKEEAVQFTTCLISSDYYLSIGKGILAIPFLNKALKHYAQITDMEPFSITDADNFAGQFRANNLKGKFKREFIAVKNLYVMDGMARKLGLDLSLDELPADCIPASWGFKDLPFFVVLGIIGALMVLNPFDEYRSARLSGNPIPIWDTLDVTDMLSVLTGVMLITINFGLLLWQYKPSYNRLMAQFYNWKFLG